MKLSETEMDGVFEAVTEPYVDHRGAFGRLFCCDELRAAHCDRPIKQINHSRTSAKGAIRGLHFQRAPKAEAKWVRCLKGKVFDVCVDLRKDSSTFLKWHAVELDAERWNTILIPEGFAHGFQVLEPESELLYLHSEVYSRELEGGLRFDDPRLAIPWPVPASDVSDRDREHPLIDRSFEGISL
ncbi:MAG: dTDP-4-keto-6-deoxy-D-glucose epimerase [Alphaproteobacteria bacterium]|nr:dTDP-4-keto-6-deoxy-D-glucose epimerase [Alphaproteobacteria bacterium]